MGISLRDYDVDERHREPLGPFIPNEALNPAWIRSFRECAAYSNFDYTTAAIGQNLLQVQLPAREELLGLLESVKGLIHAANLDHEFQSP